MNANYHVQNTCIAGPLLRLTPKLKQGLVFFMWVFPSPSQAPFRQIHPLVWASIPEGQKFLLSAPRGCGEVQPLNSHSSSRDKRGEARAEASLGDEGCVEGLPSPESNLLASPPSILP